MKDRQQKGNRPKKLWELFAGILQAEIEPAGADKADTDVSDQIGSGQLSRCGGYDLKNL